MKKIMQNTEKLGKIESWKDNGNFISRLIQEAGSGEIADIARFTGIGYQTVKHYLSGERLPNAEILAKIALNTGLSLNWLLLGIGNAYLSTEDDASPTPLEEYTITTKSKPIRHIDLKIEGSNIALNIRGNSPNSSNSLPYGEILETSTVNKISKRK